MYSDLTLDLYKWNIPKWRKIHCWLNCGPKKGFLDVSEAWAVTERHCGVSIVHMANSQTGGWPPSLPCHALAGASVDTVLANLILIVRSKEWWLSPHLWDHQVHFCGCIGIFFSSHPPSLPRLPPSPLLHSTRTIFSRSMGLSEWAHWS